ncbi:hypothetical protein ACSFA2_08225 [Variovorax sp. LT2P21]|uniref:hypothetical protein n=1 Tax=Variovorax sp. LT2P21 TaxID=3443731 RepID=UPI003F46F52C
MKNSWTVAAGLTVLVLCLAACDDGARAGLETGKSASASKSTNIETVVVTWQPRDKTAEFLSAWRPKN